MLLLFYFIQFFIVLIYSECRDYSGAIYSEPIAMAFFECKLIDIHYSKWIIKKMPNTPKQIGIILY